MSPAEEKAKAFAEANAGRMVKVKGFPYQIGRLVAWRKDGEVVIENITSPLRSSFKGSTLDGSYGNVAPNPHSGWCSLPKNIIFLDDVVATAKPSDNRYPHKCPRCQAPAYMGLVAVDCSKNCK